MTNLEAAPERVSQLAKIRVTREGWQFLFMLAFIVFAAILQDINLLILISGAFAALFLLQWRLSKRTLVGIRVQRLIPNFVEARKPIAIEIVFENSRHWLGSWLVAIQERIIREGAEAKKETSDDSTISLLLNHLLPRERRSIRYECRFAGRGAYAFRPIQLSTLFPFSLMRGTTVIAGVDRIVVFPTQGTLVSNWAGVLGLPSFGHDRRRHADRTGTEGDFFSLRDYRNGDTPRMIHWRTSAKRNNLVVRQMERLENRSILVVLDLYRDEEASETATEVAATLLTQLVQSSELVSFAIVGADAELVPLKTRTQLHAAVEQIALSKVQSDDHLVEFLRRVIGTKQQYESILVVSTRAEIEPVYGMKPIWLDVRSPSLSSIFTRG